MERQSHLWLQSAISLGECCSQALPNLWGYVISGTVSVPVNAGHAICVLTFNSSGSSIVSGSHLQTMTA